MLYIILIYFGIIRKIIYTKNDFLITLKVEAYYESNKGNTYI